MIYYTDLLTFEINQSLRGQSQLDQIAKSLFMAASAVLPEESVGSLFDLRFLVSLELSDWADISQWDELIILSTSWNPHQKHNSEPEL